MHDRYQQLSGLIPSARDVLIAPPTPPQPPRALVTEGWLDSRIDDTVRRWSCPDRRTAATLWWYSASSVILGPVAAALLAYGTATDPAGADLTIWLRPNGYLQSARSKAFVRPGPLAAGRALQRGLETTIDLLAQLGAARRQALWAIATDSWASRMLWAGRDLGEEDRASRLAVAAAEHCGSMPTPRYVNLPAHKGTTRYVRRSSCCLLYLTPGSDKCSSCPRRTPADRLALMSGSGA